MDGPSGSRTHTPDTASIASVRSRDDAEDDTDKPNYLKIKLLSPVGGRAMEFALDLTETTKFTETMAELVDHVKATFAVGLGIHNASERGVPFHAMDWTNIDLVKQYIDKLNKATSSVVTLWKGATRPKAKEENSIWNTPYCTSEHLLTICHRVFNRAVPDADTLNKHYAPFSSETYGETAFEQMQLMIDQIEIKESDVFVDLGSGVGHLVVYVAGATKVKKAVGIEIADLPCKYARNLKSEFEKMMSWFGKKYRPFVLEQGNFTDEKYRDLITKEATIIFINNYVYKPDLNEQIRQLLIECQEGTRIITTKCLGELNRRLNPRKAQNGGLTAALDIAELETVPKPTSWTDKKVPFFLHTINYQKLQQFYDQASAPHSEKSSDNSEERDVDPTAVHRSLSSTINSVAHGEDDDEDDDPTFSGSGFSDKKKSHKKRSPKWDQPDDEYVPEKKAKTTPKSHHKQPPQQPRSTVKKEKKEKEPRGRISDEHQRTLARMHDGTQSFTSPVNAPPEKKVKVEPGLPPVAPPCHHPDMKLVPADSIVLDPRVPLDQLLIESRKRFVDFMEYLRSDEAKRKLMEDYQQYAAKNRELHMKMQQLTTTVEQLLNTGVQMLNSRLQDLEMLDVVTPADLLNQSKQIVTAHKEITLQVSSFESHVLNLERNIRTSVPYGAALLEKLENADFTLEDPYGVIISQACSETKAQQVMMDNDDEHGASLGGMAHDMPSGGAPARRSRNRARVNPSRRGGNSAANANAAAATPKDNEEVERQIQEIVQKALQVDSQAKEKERRARGGGGTADRRKNTTAAVSTPQPLPANVIPATVGAPTVPAESTTLRFSAATFVDPPLPPVELPQ